jgi:hypothetical protein
MLASKKLNSVGFEMSAENYFRKFFENFLGAPESLPDFSRAKASKVILNVALGPKGRKPS